MESDVEGEAIGSSEIASALLSSRPLVELFDVLRRTFCSLEEKSAFSRLVDRALDEYAGLLLVTTPREVAGGARRYYRSELLNGSDHEPDAEDRVFCTKEEANLTGSLCSDGFHRPVIDIDGGAQLVPSSTPGHYHLYLDTPMAWEKYWGLLQALEASGVVGTFYAKAANIRKQTFVRPPWVKKTVKEKEIEELASKEAF